MNQIRMAVVALLCTTTAAMFSTITLAASDIPENFEQRLSDFIGPDYPISAIAETPLDNVYEVTAGSRVLFVSMKDELLLIGNIFDTNRGVNLGEEKQKEVAKKLAEEEISQIPLDEMIIFKGKDSTRHITVFTDVLCGYCRRLHKEVPELNKAGIEVRYLMFPAISEQSYPNAISVWCADDQQKAMTDAKLGKPVQAKTCDNPVEQQFAIGRKLGVRGTPFLILDDYTVIPGYVPAEELIKMMHM
ncbi:MAG: thiol:disulfide interchange protein DsbC [marine bacterium B5-7]|nr:MAG: thiol:disulfide interchange protein DsbC [marine bacterium B5-7]